MDRRAKFSNRIFQYRTKKGYSQKHLAKLLDKEPSQICNWEKGDKIPCLENAIKLAIALHASIEYLFYDFFEPTRIELRTREEKLLTAISCQAQQPARKDTANNNARFKNNIRAFRQKRGYSQKYLARLLGHKDPAQIYHWEKGIKIPSVKNAIRLAIALRTLIKCLFFDYFKSAVEELKVK